MGTVSLSDPTPALTDASPRESRSRAATLTLLSGGASTAVLALQSLIVVPVALHALGSRFFGAWLASGDVLAWMLALDLGLPHLIAQRVGSAHGAHDQRRVNQVFSAGLAILLLLGVLTATGATLAAPFVARSLGLTGADAVTLSRCFAAAGVATALMILSNSVVGYSRGIQNTAVVNASMFLGTVAGAVVSVGGLLSGFGLWALAGGLLARASVMLAGCTGLLLMEMRRGSLAFLIPPRGVVREFATLVPAAGVSGVCYQLMTQSESLLIGVLLRPELVPIYTVTKRGADVLRSVIDTIAMATYGGFAHLVGSADRGRALAVHARITNFRLVLAASAAAGFIAANASFVAVWAGPTMFGGPLLTLLIGLQLVAGGGSFLMNYLYRAAGAVLEGSLWQIGEAVVRIPLAAATLLLVGFRLVPIPAILTSTIATAMVLRDTRRRLADGTPAVALMTPAFAIGLVVVVAAGAALGLLVPRPSWAYVLVAGGGTAIVSALLLFRLDPHPLIPRLAFR